MKLALFLSLTLAAKLTDFTACSKTGDLEDYGTVTDDCDVDAEDCCAVFRYPDYGEDVGTYCISKANREIFANYFTDNDLINYDWYCLMDA